MAARRQGIRASMARAAASSCSDVMAPADDDPNASIHFLSRQS